MNSAMNAKMEAAWQVWAVQRIDDEMRTSAILFGNESFQHGFTSCHDLIIPLLIEALPHVMANEYWPDGQTSALVKRIHEVIPYTCRKCGGKMREGVAMSQTSTGVPDFIGSDEVCTVSPGGSGKVIDCMKCVSCGWSVTK